MAIEAQPVALDPLWSPVTARSEDDLHELFLANGWTDALPIVLPTEPRVRAMLTGTSRDPAAIVGRLGSVAAPYTVEQVAVNAVMAGAVAAELPVILALAASGVSARDGDASSPAAMVIVNGPIRHELRMNAGIGAMGPYNHANSCIGRAYGLLSQNLQGGSVPGVSYFGSQGNNYSFSNITFPENEERSPWEPFHVAHGFSASDSAVSVFGSCRHNTFTLGLRETHWRTHVTRMILGMDPSEHPAFVLDPIAARQFVERGGLDSRAKFSDWVYSVAQLRAREYWGYRRVQAEILPRARSGEEPYASMLAAGPDDILHVFPRETVEVAVVGGETNGYWRMFGANYATTMSVDAWR
jgi:hypothetical protein